MKRPVISIIRAGLIRYNEGMQLQNKLAQQPPQDVQNFCNYMILQEFHPVFTTGLRNKDYSEEDEKKLQDLGAEFYRTNRGGLITFHGPGQLVAYPIIHLKQFTPSIRWYVQKIEETVIDACKELGVSNAKTTEDTGIWVGDNKICAIGLHASRFITTHGIGFNACTDLNWFDHIVPCGIEGKGVTSLSKELQRHVSVGQAEEAFISSFAKIFQCDIKTSS